MALEFLPKISGQVASTPLTDINQYLTNTENQFYDDEDDDELFLWYGLLMKAVQPYFQLGPLSEILTIANL